MKLCEIEILKKENRRLKRLVKKLQERNLDLLLEMKEIGNRY
jgi:hypothetical protein